MAGSRKHSRYTQPWGPGWAQGWAAIQDRRAAAGSTAGRARRRHRPTGGLGLDGDLDRVAQATHLDLDLEGEPAGEPVGVQQQQQPRGDRGHLQLRPQPGAGAASGRPGSSWVAAVTAPTALAAEGPVAALAGPVDRPQPAPPRPGPGAGAPRASREAARVQGWQ